MNRKVTFKKTLACIMAAVAIGTGIPMFVVPSMEVSAESSKLNKSINYIPESDPYQSWTNPDSQELKDKNAGITEEEARADGKACYRPVCDADKGRPVVWV